MALVSALFPSRDEGSTGPSLLETGDDSTTRGAGQVTHSSQHPGLCRVPHPFHSLIVERAAGMNFAHRPVAPASASGTWDSSTLRLNFCRDSDYRPHHRWLRRINLLRRTIGDWGCGGKLSRRRGHTPYPPSHIFKTLQ
jgi:hypothetical protein